MKNYWAARVLFSRSNFCSHVKNVSQSIGAEIRFFFRGIELLWNSISENSRKRGFKLDASTMETFVSSYFPKLSQE